MRILIYTHEYPPFRGGAGTYSRDLAHGLAALGGQVGVVCPDYGLDFGDAERSGVRLYPMRLWELEPPWCYRSLLYAWAKHRPDVVLITDRDSQKNVARMPFRYFPYAIVVHGTEIWHYFDVQRTGLSPGEEQTFREFFRGAESVIAVSQATADLLSSYLPEMQSKVRVVRNGIDVARFATPGNGSQRLRQQLDIGSDHVLLSLGRLGPDKGQDVLLRAFRRVLQDRPETVLLLAGHGEMRSTLEEIAAAEGVLGRTRFLGNVSSEDLPALFDLADVFVLTSRCQQRWEGFGLVYLEANYFGKPVIGAAVGGVPEAIQHEVSGLLVDPDDDDGVATAILRLLSDPELRRTLGQQGQKRVLNQFTAAHMARRTWQVLEGAMLGRRTQLSRRVYQAYGFARWLAYSCWLTGSGRLQNLLLRRHKST